MRADWRLWLFCTALPLTTATQLRLPGLGLGPGEVLLAVGLLLVGWNCLRSPWTPTTSKSQMAMGLYWLVASLSLFLGLIAGLITDHSPGASALHDLLAYLLAMCVSLAVVFLPRAGQQAGRLVLGMAWATSLPAAVMWVYALFREWLGPLDLWYGLRYTGWAANPNQLALLLLPAPFLLFHLVESSEGGKDGRAVPVLVLLASLAMAAGWSTDSGALRLAWTVCLPLILLASMWRIRRGQERARQGVYAFLLAVVMAGLLGRAAGLMPIRAVQGQQIRAALQADLDRSGAALPGGLPGLRRDEAENLAWSLTEVRAYYYEGDDLSVRTSLLLHGLMALERSPLFGLGPGSFSGLEGPFQGSEAHNTLVDWGTNTGILGMAALSVLVLWIGHRLWRTGRYSLLAGLVALILFSQFHHVLRHPLVWAYLALAAWIADDVRASRPHPVAGPKGQVGRDQVGILSNLEPQ